MIDLLPFIPAVAVLALALCYALGSLALYVRSGRKFLHNEKEYEIASPSVLRELLRLTGAYFIYVQNDKIHVSNAGTMEVASAESGLESNKDVKDFISSLFAELRSQSGASVSGSVKFRESLSGSEKHWYEMHLLLLKHRAGRVRSYGIVVPIDMLKQRERDEMEMHRRALNAEERDDFIREMNHAVRTPLNAIVGFSELLADPDMDISPEEVEEYRTAIEENAFSLTEIIENVLVISHMNSENLMLNDVPLSIPQLVRAEMEKAASKLEKSGIVVTEDASSPEELNVKADSIITGRIVRVFVDNVISHASSGKSLEYGWRAAGSGGEIFVRDKGPGIGNEDSPFIYKAFYKADPFSKGSGLGLTIAKGYATRENADITCESAPGGTSFFLKFKNILPALMPLPFIGLGFFLFSCLALYLAYTLYRTVKYRTRLRIFENEVITHSMDVLGGHFFKLEGGEIIVSSGTAEAFDFSTNVFSLDRLEESFDDSNREVIRKIKELKEGEVVSELISIPNFRAFKIMTFSCIASRVKDDSGKMVPMGIFFSVDEERARLEALHEVYAREEESVAKQSFIASMGHEIRNPLNAIVGFSSLLSERYFEIDEEERNSYAQIIGDSNRHMLELLDGALLSAKEQDKMLKRSFKVVNVSDIMEELFKTNQTLIPDRLSFDFVRGGDALVNISRTGLRQIVSNLINNASKFTPEGGITLGWSVSADDVEIYVQDTGIGVSAEDIENIFKKFYKTDSSTSGAGIGLPLCRRFAEMMGGRLLVNSELGKGSKFSVKLPRVYQET